MTYDTTFCQNINLNPGRVTPCIARDSESEHPFYPVGKFTCLMTMQIGNVLKSRRKVNKFLTVLQNCARFLGNNLDYGHLRYQNLPKGCGKSDTNLLKTAFVMLCLILSISCHIIVEKRPIIRTV